MDYSVLSNEHVFVTAERDGEITPGRRGLGLYHRDTRHLSALALRLNGQPLTLLSGEDAEPYAGTLLLANPWMRAEGGDRVPAQSIGVERARVVSDGLYERLTLTNYNRASLHLLLSLELAADFADLFQVRGIGVGQRGALRKPAVGDGEVLLTYEGTDGVARHTRITYSLPPDEFDASTPDPGATHTETGPAVPESGRDEPRQEPRPVRVRLAWRLELAPQTPAELHLAFIPSAGATASAPPPAASTAKNVAGEAEALRRSYADWLGGATAARTGDAGFDRLLERGALDLRALAGPYPGGPVPFAGIPWYAVPFGRDSLITALQTLAFRPELATGTLRFLAARQGAQDDPYRDEQPGRIMHELRFGELAGTRAIPHTPYYGSVDATPLFLMLFAETMRWTGDRALYEELLPAVHRALEWIDRYGDEDDDGYVEFRTRSERGIENQGWKDSWDSVLYPDGERVPAPVALVEVQGYVYAAKTWLAPLLRRMGDDALAERLEREAAALRERFNRDFFIEDASYYAQALDGGKRRVEDATSNAGHALLCGILPPDRARLVARRLLAPDMASGWGVRTRASSDHNYNPMSYHNGSVWPHDNALIIWGLARAGCVEEAAALSRQVLDAGARYPRARLPELYCGFGRGEGGEDRPADYPVSCSPQAWAAGTGWLILRGLLGLEPDAWEGTLRVSPSIPDWLGEVELWGVRVGGGTVDLRVVGGGVEVLGGDVRVEVAPIAPG